MFKIISAIILSIGLSVASAVEIPDSLLTPDQKAFVSQKTTQASVSGWVGIGKEVGDAVNSSMSAITTQTNNFANTPVGKYVLWIVTYTVLKNLIIAIALVSTMFFFSAVFVGATYYISYREADSDVREGWNIAYVVLGIINLLVIVFSIANI